VEKLQAFLGAFLKIDLELGGKNFDSLLNAI
jgi:hypothetical protein